MNLVSEETPDADVEDVSCHLWVNSCSGRSFIENKQTFLKSKKLIDFEHVIKKCSATYDKEYA